MGAQAKIAKSTYEHPRLGAITVSPSGQARRITVSVRPGGEVRLSFPRRVSLRAAMEFLDSKVEWVERARAKMAAKAPPKEVITMPFSTRSHHLTLNPAQTLKVSSKLAGDRIVVTYPAAMHFGDEPVQKEIRRGIEKAWGAEAKALLPGRLEELARGAGLAYRSVAVRNTVSRWGSCSSRNDISLSLHLMRLPDELIDYILLHELCHIAHKDHSARFYRLLDTLVGGNHATLRREMKKYNPRW